ncbi:uncharacterized protein LOC115440004 [Manduca sexta]|uniref:uncharacterized protein LOC115440004 n=1 Tax=Manduca sexta TaxID=7130 RepID=UPI00118276A3|nr:uncharacterized protein LOC115440004 [Manduca sexta]
MSDSSGDANIADSDKNDADSDSSSDNIVCTKLTVAENILAYIQKRELDRVVEDIKCDSSLLESVMANYVIAKKIISNLSWQEKFLCKHVCSMWHSAVVALQKEQLEPADFVVNDLPVTVSKINSVFKKSTNFYTEPLAVLTFANMLGFSATNDCGSITPNPCSPACQNVHCLLDVVQHNVCMPKVCMLTVKATYLTFMPLSPSITYEHVFTQQMIVQNNPFISGIYIPTIPDVEFNVINIKSVANMQNDFFDVVHKIAQDRIFKGVVVYVTESFLLESVEDIVFLNYFKDVQPNVPYALGGCIVEDTMFEKDNIDLIVENINKGVDFVSENLVTIAMFTVPHNSNVCNFDVYSLIVESSDWTKAKIRKTIDEFAKKVPRFEHSVALKLSCVGRDQRHEVEQEYFRAAFPRTRLIGCYGNGELGVNHPAKPPLENMPSGVKRHRRDPGPQFGIMYSYSTVFVYMGWGKKFPPESI